MTSYAHAQTHSGAERPPFVRAKASAYINNISNTSDNDRETFLIVVIKLYVLYGATFDMIEDHLLELARHFNVKVTIVRKARRFVCILGDYGYDRRLMDIRENLNRQANEYRLLEVRETSIAVTRNKMAMGEGILTLNSMPLTTHALRHPTPHLALGAALSGFMAITFLEANVGEAVCAAGFTVIFGALAVQCRKISNMGAYMAQAAITVVLTLVVHDHCNMLRTLSNVAIGILPGFYYFCNMLWNADYGGQVAVEGYLKSAMAMIYVIALKAGLPIILDFCLMFHLLVLVVLGSTVNDKFMQRGHGVFNVSAYHKMPKPLAMIHTTTTTKYGFPQ